MLGKIEGKRWRGQQRMRWLDSITNSMDIWANSGRQWRTEESGVLQSAGSQSQTQLSEWTTITYLCVRTRTNPPNYPAGLSCGPKSSLGEKKKALWKLETSQVHTHKLLMKQRCKKINQCLPWANMFLRHSPSFSQKTKCFQSQDLGKWHQSRCQPWVPEDDILTAGSPQIQHTPIWWLKSRLVRWLSTHLCLIQWTDT